MVDEQKVNDDIGQLSKEEYLKSLRRELEMFEKNLETEYSTRERYERQNERQRKLWKLMLDNYTPVEGTAKMQFETLPEFWELQKEIQVEKVEQEEQLIKSRMKKFEADIEAIKYQIEEKKKRIAETEA